MLLIVLVYAYTQQIYSSRRIAIALRENIPFMWLSGMSQPDFRTINGFRRERMKNVIQEVFAAVVEVLVAEWHIQLEHYFVDGTKVEANANKHRVIWAKRNRKYQERLQEQVKDLLDEIEQANEAENETYGDRGLDELGEGKTIDSERLKQKPDDKPLKVVVKKMETNYLPRQQKYEEQVRKLAGRKSYARSDEDTTNIPAFSGEALLLGIVSFASAISVLVAPHMFPLGTLEQLALTNNLLYGLAPVWERFFTILVHIFSNVLLFYGVQKRQMRWFWLAFAYKSGVDAIAAFAQFWGVGTISHLWTIEVIVAFWGFIGWAGLQAIKKRYPAPELSSQTGDFLSDAS